MKKTFLPGIIIFFYKWRNIFHLYILQYINVQGLCLAHKTTQDISNAGRIIYEQYCRRCRFKVKNSPMNGQQSGNARQKKHAVSVTEIVNPNNIKNLVRSSLTFFHICVLAGCWYLYLSGYTFKNYIQRNIILKVIIAHNAIPNTGCEWMKIWGGGGRGLDFTLVEFCRFIPHPSPPPTTSPPRSSDM